VVLGLDLCFGGGSFGFFYLELDSRHVDFVLPLLTLALPFVLYRVSLALVGFIVVVSLF
jgi:hypothetical protein